MRPLRSALLKTVAIFPPWLWIAALWLKVGFQFVQMHSGFFSYGYDFDPGDGDVVNAVLRIAHGEPIYGDWLKGEVLLLYPPLIPGLFAIAARLGVEVLPLGRTLGVLMIPLASLLTGLLARELIGKRARGAWAFACLAGLIQMSTWFHLRLAINFRPDPFVLVECLLATWLIARDPRRTGLAAALTALCLLSKQSGAVILAACLGWYALFDRGRLPRYGGLVALLTGIPVAVTEWLSRGQFLRSILIHPARFLADPAKLEWEHFGELWSEHYTGALPWMIPLALFGLGRCARTRSRQSAFLVLALLADLAYLFKTGRHVGAGAPYLWLHWALMSAVAAMGAAELARFASRIPLTPWRLRITERLAVTLVAASLTALLYTRNFEVFVQASPENLSPAQDTGRREDERIQRLIARNPGARWLAVRAPMSILRNGKLLDREMCTLNGAFADQPDSPGARALLEDFRSGHYGYFQAGHPLYRCGVIPGFEEILAECWKKVDDAEVTFYTALTTTPIYRWTGPSERCR